MADLVSLFIFSIGRNSRIFPSTPLNAFIPSKHLEKERILAKQMCAVFIVIHVNTVEPPIRDPLR